MPPTIPANEAGSKRMTRCTSFAVDGVACAGMEGFLQSLKVPDPKMQKRICAMEGDRANEVAAAQDWRAAQTLYLRRRLTA
jgi:hypothetical protein